MPKLRCAFDGHVHRANICEGDAEFFLRTPRGILWPFCGPCNERHKRLLMDMVKMGSIDHTHVITTSFDVPIIDVLVEEFREQDPKEIREVLARADAMHDELQLDKP